MFEFRHQPLKIFYTVYAFSSILVRLPFWSIMAALPFIRPRKSWTFSRTLWVRFVTALVATWFKMGFPLEPNLVDNPEDGCVWLEPIPDSMIKDEIKTMADRNGVRAVRIPVCWFGKKGSDENYGQRAEPGEKVMYYFHGGAFTMGSAATKEDSLTCPFAISIPRRNPEIFQRSFRLDYRLSTAHPYEPKNPLPAAILDTVAGYRYLVEDVGFEPKDIIICGDSVGGLIAVDLIRYLILADIPRLSVPGALILLSPSGDWSDSHDDGSPTSSAVENRSSDFVHEIMTNGYTVRGVLGSLPPREITTNPWFSPSSRRIPNPEGLFKGFPPTFITCGGSEEARDDKRTLRDRMVKDCGESQVTYFEYPDAVHNFVMMVWHEPERTQALDDLHRWLKKVATE